MSGGGPLFMLISVLLVLLQVAIPAVFLYLIYRGYRAIITRLDNIQTQIQSLRHADPSRSTPTES